MSRGSKLIAFGVASAVCLVGYTGCSTTAAKTALNKPTPEDHFTGFGVNDKSSKVSERKSAAPEPVRDDLEPEKAIDLLVDYMQRREPAYFIPAEDEMRYWAQKQGVPQIIVQKVRPLLRNQRIEVRAPALRLTCAYGQRDSLSDMIEAMTDEDYGMRKTAFESLKQRTQQDFGFNPGSGEPSRAEAVKKWRGWWQDSQRTMLASQVPVGAYTAPEPPKVSRAGEKNRNTDTADTSAGPVNTQFPQEEK